jgi:hypothetical protein
MMGYELGDDAVRVTVRVPRALYTAYTAKVRALFHAAGIPSLSAAIRLALTHWLECHEQQRIEAGARRVMEARDKRDARQRRRRP